MRTAEFRSDLNGLRAVAVILVLLFHFDLRGFRGGFVGVDVFFVISGFLMTQIIVSKLSNGTFRVREFYLARLRRIFPALGALCLSIVVLGWFAVAPLQYAALGRHAVASIAFISNVTFWRESGYFDAASHEKWLLHTWSLSVEWQFYLLFPILLAGAWRIFATRRALVATVGILVLTSFALSVLLAPIRPDASYFLTPTRIWELAMGGVAYFAPFPAHLPNVIWRLMSRFGAAFILLSAVLMSSDDPWPGYHAAVPVLGASMIVFARDGSFRMLRNAPMQFLGNASYSIYLWHWPIVVVLVHTQRLGDPLAVAGGLGAAIILGHISYRVIEGPARRIGSLLPPRSEAAAYGVVAGIVGGGAFLVSWQQGFPQRLDGDASAYVTSAAASSDWQHPGTNCDQDVYFVRCRNPGTQRKTLFVLGDSLAEQWYPRYGSSPLVSHSSVFVTQSGCPPIRGIQGTRPATRNCQKFADAAWAEVRATKPDALVVASIWTTYFLSSSGEMKESYCLPSESGCVVIADRQKLAKAFEQFQRDVAEAVQMGSNVTIIGSTPTASHDPVRVSLARIASTRLPLSVDAQVARQSGNMNRVVDSADNHRVAVLNTILQEVARRSGATFVNPFDFMCAEQGCQFYDAEGIPLYMDADHLRGRYVQSDSFAWLDRSIGIVRR